MLHFLLILALALPCMAKDASNPGTYVDLPQREKLRPHEYLKRVKQTLKDIQQHPQQTPAGVLPIFASSGSTAVIMGAGTTGLLALTWAARVLPARSTIIMLQNDINFPEQLEKTILQELPDIRRHQLIISPPLEMGDQERLLEVLHDYRGDLQKTQLFIHAADWGEHVIPDRVPYQEVLRQIMRRSSVALLTDIIEGHAKPELGIVRILVSSECSEDRSKVRIPNLAPYQIGQVVGDIFFKEADVRSNSYSFVLYPGSMSSIGQEVTRIREYYQLKAAGYNPINQNGQEFARVHVGSYDQDPMDIVGAMLKTISSKLKVGQFKKDHVYGLHAEEGQVSVDMWRPAPYKWAPLEQSFPAVE